MGAALQTCGGGQHVFLLDNGSKWVRGRGVITAFSGVTAFDGVVASYRVLCMVAFIGDSTEKEIWSCTDCGDVTANG